MVEGNGKWKNHPCNFMYKDHIEWIKLYRDCLIAYKNKDYELCKSLSKQAEKIQPDFLCEELYDNFKRRLYTKDPSLYKRWEHLGKSDANYYYVDGNWLKYENGKKEIVNNI